MPSWGAAALLMVGQSLWAFLLRSEPVEGSLKEIRPQPLAYAERYFQIHDNATSFQTRYGDFGMAFCCFPKPLSTTYGRKPTTLSKRTSQDLKSVPQEQQQGVLGLRGVAKLPSPMNIGHFGFDL